MPERYFEVSNSCIPNSPKLKTLSTMTCACFFMPSIWPARSALIEASLSGVTLFCAKAFCDRATWTAQDARNTAKADLNIDASVPPFNDILQVGHPESHHESFAPGLQLAPDRDAFRLPEALQAISG